MTTGIAIDSSGRGHIVTSAEVSVDEDLTERYAALCGANFQRPFLDLNAIRLGELYERGDLCDTCLERLRDREATIPGFISDGEVVARV